jgi:segregation and condensation protein A
VQSEQFEGPLDLLLDEVRRQNVEIETLALAPIVSRFLDYVTEASSKNLNLDIDWLHMAAVLIHWKSQALLPANAERTGGDPIRDTLIQQLLAHRRQAAMELEQRRSLAARRFSRTEGALAGDEPVQPREPSDVSVWDLVRQARQLAGWVVNYREAATPEPELRVEPDDVSVSEMMDYLRMQLPDGNTPIEGTRLLIEQTTPSRRACLFLGLLEMGRNGEVQVIQDEGFGPIWIRRALA